MDSLAEYNVLVGGRNHKVKLLNVVDEKALIELDGRTIEIRLQKEIGFDKLIPIKANGRNYQIRLHKNDRAMAFNVEVDGRLFALHLEHKRRGFNNETPVDENLPALMLRREKMPVRKSGFVTSLMPGKVVLLKVKVGDKVKAGDPLCVLEAMKMENEIVASKEGVVTKVNVGQGSIVDKSEVLVVIE